MRYWHPKTSRLPWAEVAALSGGGCSQALVFFWHQKAELWPQSAREGFGSLPGPVLYSGTARLRSH